MWDGPCERKVDHFFFFFDIEFSSRVLTGKKSRGWFGGGGNVQGMCVEYYKLLIGRDGVVDGGGRKRMSPLMKIEQKKSPSQMSKKCGQIHAINFFLKKQKYMQSF